MSVTLMLALLLASPPQDPPVPSPVEVRRTVSGQWSGALGYRDYQTDQLFELPVRTTVVWVEDGVTQIQTSLYDDGPSHPVWITSVSLDDPAAATVATGSYRAGRPASLSTESVAVRAWRDDTHWTLVYSSVGEDDDQPAEMRVTETRDGDDLLSVKEVRPVGAGDEAWRFRNQTRLHRVGD